MPDPTSIPRVATAEPEIPAPGQYAPIPRLTRGVSVPTVNTMDPKLYNAANYYSDTPWTAAATSDPESMMGYKQSLGSKFGRFLLNLPMNTLASVIEMPLSAATFIAGDNEGVVLDGMRDMFGKLHRENPNAMFDPTDASSWLGTADSLITSIASFILPGQLIGTGLKSLALLANGTRAARLTMLGSHVASAATMAYIEGAQVGQEMYKKELPNLVNKLMYEEGLEPEAAQAKAEEMLNDGVNRTVLTNVLLNTGLNMFMLAPIFKSTKRGVERAIRTSAKPGETFLQSVARQAKNAGAEAEAFAKTTSANIQRRALLEAPQESLEEINNEYASRAGAKYAQDKQRNSLIEDLTDLNTWAGTAISPEGIMSAVLGAVGGGGQAIGMGLLPTNGMTVKVDANGKPVMQLDEQGNTVPVYEKKWMSNYKRDGYGYQAEYLSAIQAVASDVNNYNQELQKIQAEKDPVRKERMLDELFALNVVSSIEKGQADGWIAEYKRIVGLDNTVPVAEKIQKQIDELKAMRTETPEDTDKKNRQIDKLTKDLANAGSMTEAEFEGLSSGPKDNAYKKNAEEAAKKVEKLKALSEKYREKYETADEETGRNYSGFMFARAAMMDVMDDSIKELQDLYDEQVRNLPATGEITAVREVTRQFKSAALKQQSLLDDITMLRAYAEGNVTIDQARPTLNRYKIGPPDSSDFNKSFHSVLSRLHDDLATTQNTLRDLNEIFTLSAETELTRKDDPQSYAHPGAIDTFRKWLAKPGNSKKTFQDFVDSVISNSSDDTDLALAKAEIEMQQLELSIHREEFKRMDSVAGLRTFIKVTDGYRERQMKLQEQMLGNPELEELAKRLRWAARPADSGYYTSQHRQMRIAELRREFHKLRNKLLAVTESLSEFPIGDYFTKFDKYLELTRLKKDLELRLNTFVRHGGAVLTPVIYPHWQPAAKTARIDAYLEAMANGANIDDAFASTYGQDTANALQLIAAAAVTNRIKAAEALRRIEETMKHSVKEASKEEVQYAVQYYTRLLSDQQRMGPTAMLSMLEGLMPSEVVAKMQEHVTEWHKLIDERIKERGMTIQEVRTMRELFSHDIFSAEVANGLITPTEAALISHTMSYVVYDRAQAEYDAMMTAQQAEDLVGSPAVEQMLNGGPELNLEVPGLDTIHNALGKLQAFQSALADKMLDDYRKGKVLLESNMNKLRQELLTDGFTTDEADEAMRWLFSSSNPVVSDIEPETVKQPIMIARQRQNGLVVTNKDALSGKTQDSTFIGSKVALANKVQLITIENLHLGKFNTVTGRLEFRFYGKPDGILQENLERIRKLKRGNPLVLRIDRELVVDGRVWDSMRLVPRPNAAGKDVLENETKPVGFYSFANEATQLIETDEGVAEVPIAVYMLNMETGQYEKLGWYPRASWVDATIPNADNYMHLQDDTVKEANRQVMDVRRALVDAHNSNPTVEWELAADLSSPLDGATEQGKLIKNIVFSETNRSAKVEMDRFDNLIMDETATIGVGNDDGTSVILDKTGDIAIPSSIPVLPGVPYAIVKDWDGRDVPIPMTMDKLSNADITAATALINAFLTQNTTIREQWLAATGLDIFLPVGLRTALEQYYTYVENDTLDKEYHKGSQAISVTSDGRVHIKHGDFSTFIADATNRRELDVVAEKALRDILSERRVSVLYDNKGVKGLVSNAPYVQPKYKSEGFVFADPDQNFKYTDYVKSRATTSVYGLNMTPDGKFIYTSNPVMHMLPITLQPTALIDGQAVSTVPAKSDDVAYEPEMESIYSRLLGEDEDVFGDEFENDDEVLDLTIREVTANSLPMTIANLQNLSTLAANNHNGRSVQEVYAELRRQGQSHISMGRNPFRQCP